MLYELGDAARVLELGALGVACLWISSPLVSQRNLKALVEEGELTCTLGQRFLVVFGCGEDALVGQEVYFRSTLLAGARLTQIARGQAAAEVHLPRVAIAPDLDAEFLAERVDAAHADTMQPSGDLVGGRIEFAAGVKLGEHHLHGR